MQVSDEADPHSKRDGLRRCDCATSDSVYGQIMHLEKRRCLRNLTFGLVFLQTFRKWSCLQGT